MSENALAETNDVALPTTPDVPNVPGLFNFDDFASAWDAAEKLAGTSLIPKEYSGKPAEVLACWQYGLELGIPPMQSLTAIAVINGRPSLYGDGFLAVIRAHPDFRECIEQFDEQTMTAKCIMRRRGQSDVERTFSQADATTAGLWSKAGPWKQYPKRMLQMRARGFAGRDAFADALRGMMIVDEARDTAEREIAGETITPSPEQPTAKADRVLEQLQPETDKAGKPDPDDGNPQKSKSVDETNDASPAASSPESDPDSATKDADRAFMNFVENIKKKRSVGSLDLLEKAAASNKLLTDEHKERLAEVIDEKRQELSA